MPRPSKKNKLSSNGLNKSTISKTAALSSQSENGSTSPKREAHISSEVKESSESETRTVNMLPNQIPSAVQKSEENNSPELNEKSEAKFTSQHELSSAVFGEVKDKIVQPIYSKVSFDEILTFLDPWDKRTPINDFFLHFEETASVLELNSVQKVIFLRKLLKDVEYFLKTKPLSTTYLELKTYVIEEFEEKNVAATIHQKLNSTFKDKLDTNISYLYKLQSIGSSIQIDDSSIKHYLLKNLNLHPTVDLQIRNCETMEQIKKILKNLDKQTEESHNINKEMETLHSFSIMLFRKFIY